MKYILSKEYMCRFLPLQKTSSSTIELSNHLRKRPLTLCTLIWVVAYSMGFDYIYTNLMSTTGNKPLPLFDVCRKLLTNV